MPTERQLRKLQKKRHMYDIQQMILSNPIFKNLGERDQRSLRRLIYKAEMMEMFLRDKQMIRVNESFESIIAAVADMLDEKIDGENPDFDEDR